MATKKVKRLQAVSAIDLPKRNRIEAGETVTKLSKSDREQLLELGAIKEVEIEVEVKESKKGGKGGSNESNEVDGSKDSDGKGSKKE